MARKVQPYQTTERGWLRPMQAVPASETEARVRDCVRYGRLGLRYLRLQDAEALDPHGSKCEIWVDSVVPLGHGARIYWHRVFSGSHEKSENYLDHVLTHDDHLLSLSTVGFEFPTSLEGQPLRGF